MTDYEDVPEFAWLHQCGHLNAGLYHPDNWLGEHATCGGCSCEVKRDTEVTAFFRLSPTERPSHG